MDEALLARIDHKLRNQIMLDDGERAALHKNAADAADVAAPETPANTRVAANAAMLRYPVDKMGPTLGPAANAIAKIVQLPVEIAAQSVLATAALMAQQFANVTIDGRTRPPSLNLLTVARSGDRKSEADRHALSAVEDYIDSEMAAYRTQLADYEEAREAGEENAPPRFPGIICQEPTLESIQKDLYYGRPSQGLFNDEGGQFFGGHAMRPENALKTMAGLSKFWDGRPITRNRAVKGESITLTNRRLSMHLMVQPRVAEKVLSDETMIDQGILARFLIARPRSIQGHRPYNRLDAGRSTELAEYNRLITELLQKGYRFDEESGLALDNIVIPAGSRPYEAWVDFYNDIETGIRDRYSCISPAASKIPEQAQRIACVLAVMRGDREITEDDMINAIYIAKYYVDAHVAAEEFVASEGLEERLTALKEMLREKKLIGKMVQARKLSPLMTVAIGSRNTNTVRELMGYLEEEGWVRESEESIARGNKATEWRVMGEPHER